MSYEGREPQPSDGPDFHAEHAAWAERRAAAMTDSCDTQSHYFVGGPGKCQCGKWSAG